MHASTQEHLYAYTHTHIYTCTCTHTHTHTHTTSATHTLHTIFIWFKQIAQFPLLEWQFGGTGFGHCIRRLKGQNQVQSVAYTSTVIVQRQTQRQLLLNVQSIIIGYIKLKMSDGISEQYTRAQKLSNFLKQCTNVQALIQIHPQNLLKLTAHSLVRLPSVSNQYCARTRPHRSWTRG